MKITQLRGDLTAFRNLELSIVLNAMKTENSRKPVTTLRQNIPYLTPRTKSLAAEKIPVVLFGVTLKRDEEEDRCGHLCRIGAAQYRQPDRLCGGGCQYVDRAAGFPQTLASFVSDRADGALKSWFLLPCRTVRCQKTERHMRLFHAHACLRARTLLRSTAPVARRMERRRMPARRNKDAVCRMIPTCIIIRMRLPIRLEQPLQMPAPVTTREAHDAETDPSVAHGARL